MSTFNPSRPYRHNLTAPVSAARAFVAMVLAVALPGFAALSLSGCGGEAPDLAPMTAPDAAVGTDGPVVDPRTDVPPVTRRDSGVVDAVDSGTVDAARDAGVDAGTPADTAPVDSPTVDSPATQDAGPEVDVLRVDVGLPHPLGRSCSTGADCPAFPGWTCLGAPGACRCTPSGGDDLCGRRDRDCDGVADPETVCSGQCVDTRSSAQHCGGCGRACMTGEGCVAGACRCETPGTGRRTLCGACVDVTTRGSGSAFCTFCRTTCGSVARRQSPEQYACCNAACGIGITPDPCR